MLSLALGTLAVCEMSPPSVLTSSVSLLIIASLTRRWPYTKPEDLCQALNPVWQPVYIMYFL